MSDVDKQVEEVWNESWVPILICGGELDLQQLKRELYDFSCMMREVAIVYDTLTGGLVSKPNTCASTVIELAEEHAAEMAEEAT